MKKEKRSDMSLIVAKSLSKIYKTDNVEVQALQHLSFDIEAEAFLALIGPSGSGKTTLRNLNFTPAVTSTMNFTALRAMRNLELRFRTPVLIGKNGTEYGENLNDYRVELRLRYHFNW